MKIDLGLSGAEASPADFALLKAALIAAQAATPTARASHAAPASADARDALEQMFTGTSSSGSVAAALHHRFAAAALPQEENKVNGGSTSKVGKR